MFLERVFHKLLLNFTWWVNRKDTEGKNIFEGGFLGLDNIGVFDRSSPLPTGGRLEQSDATSWMGMYCLNMLTMALELARENRAYEDVASKFFEHFVYICRAVNNIGGKHIELWDRTDGFFYDVLHLPNGETRHVKIRSMVGLIPLFAVETLDSTLIDSLPRFKHRMQWFIENRPEFAQHVETQSYDGGVRRFLSLVNRHRLRSVMRYLLDENEFLSPYGIRALSRYHKDHPYVLKMMGHEHRVDYEPAESSTPQFGGNSNWRGPIWFPVNYLLIESLQKFHYFLGDHYQVEYPVGSGQHATLGQVARGLSQRLISLFLRDAEGKEFPLSKDGKEGLAYGLLSWSPDSRTLAAFRIQPGERKEVHLIQSSPRGGGRARHSSRPYDLPGDRIDIVLNQRIQVVQPTTETINSPAEQQRFEAVAGLESATTVKTVLQNKRVIYVSQARTVAVGEEPTPAEDGEQGAPPEIASVIIVFAGTDQDAELIKLAQNDVSTTGPLTAVVRNRDDDVAEATTGVTLSLLIERYGVPVPNLILLQTQ